MNNFISDWNFEGDLPATGQKNPTGADHDLVELLWRNGQVVLHSQTHRKQAPNILNEPPRQSHNKSNDNQATRPCGTYGNYPINNMAQDDETVSWIHFPIEDSFEKEFCSNFFSELPSCDPIDVDRPFEGDKPSKPGASDAATAALTRRLKPPCPESQMPPPRGSLGRVVSLPPPPSGHDKSDYRPSGQGEAGECSLMTVGLSHCGSNQLANDLDVSWVSSNNGDGSNTGLSAPPPSFKCEGAREKNVRRMPQSESGKTETLEPTVTSSSGGSGSSFGRACKQSTATTTSGNTTNNKRKAREAEELECQSEAAELESAAANKSAQRSGTSRKSRAAEVHNQSERRRRDRINEKMKALQELIPHSNKTDKASMLDEAIEYLKSLQLQLQVMWMGSGMTPMMFPGVQHYMSRMSMAMGPPALPSMHMAPPQQHRVPVVDHQAAAAPMIVGPTGDHQAFNPLNYQNHHQMQGASFPDQYARFMGFHPMETHVSQPVNIFRYSPQTVQQGQSIAQQGIITTGPSTAGGAPIDGTALSGKMG